jgi:hypothetical protein
MVVDLIRMEKELTNLSQKWIDVVLQLWQVNCQADDHNGGCTPYYRE